MKLLILGVILACLCSCIFCSRRKKQKNYAAKRVYKEIADINTLLQNVEVYDGTSLGQRPIVKGGRK